MCNNDSTSPSKPTSVPSRLNSQSASSDDTSVGSWSGHSVRTMEGTSYTPSSDDDQSYITASDGSQSNLTAPSTPATLNNNYTDNGTDLDAVNLDIKGKSIFSKIRDVISKRITLKKLIFLYVPIAAVLVISIATGVGFPLVIGVGLASIYFIGAALAKYLSSYNPEDSENPGVNREREQQLVEKFNKIQDKLVEDGVQEKAKYLEVYKEKDKDEVDKDKKEIQDPSTLSTWQKVKQKLKIATPFIFGAAIIALGITATVVTGGVFGIIGVAIASMLGVLCIGKGITEVLDYRDEKQAFLDSQNLDDQKDYVDALDQIDNEDEIFEDALEQIDNEDDVFEDALTETELNKITQETKARRNRYDLTRFREAHEGKEAFRIKYDEAIYELRRGKKTGHWIWYIFPQLESLGKTKNSKFYGLKSQEEALEYLLDDDLGTKLVKCTEAVLEHKDKSCQDIFGSPIDNKKFHSCMELFNKTLQDYINNGNELPIWLPDTEIFSKGLNKQ